VPSERAPIRLHRHLRDDREIAERADGRDRLLHLQQVAEGLEDEEIHAALQQPLRLLAEEPLRLDDGGGPVGLDAQPERPHRPRDQRPPRRRRPRDLCRASIDRPHLPSSP
jgi:hypothetical protein